MTYETTFPNVSTESDTIVTPAQHRRLEARIREFGLDRETVKLWCLMAFGVGSFPALTNRQYNALDQRLPDFMGVARKDEEKPQLRYQRLSELVGKFQGNIWRQELDKALSISLDIFRGWPEPGKSHGIFFRHLMANFERRIQVSCVRCRLVSPPFESRAGWTRAWIGEPGFPSWVCPACSNGRRQPKKKSPTAPPGKEDAPEAATPAEEDEELREETRAIQRQGWISGPARATRARAEKARENRNLPFRALKEPPDDRCSVCGLEKPPGHVGWVFLHRLINVEVGLAAGAKPMLTQVRYWICPHCWNAGNLPFSVADDGDRREPGCCPALDRVAKDIVYIAERYAENPMDQVLRTVAEALRQMGVPAPKPYVPPVPPPAGLPARPAPAARPAPTGRARPPKAEETPTGETPEETFRRRLRRLRGERGLSTDALGARAGMTGSGITKIETGKTKTARPATVARLAHALGVAPEEVFPGWPGPPTGRGPFAAGH